MKNYKCLLLPNEQKDEGLTLTRRLCTFLHAEGCTPFVLPAIEQQFRKNDKEVPEGVRVFSSIDPSTMDLLVPIGGDGTIIGSIRTFKDYEIPVLGINLGDLGFLAEVEPSQAEEALHKVLTGNYHTEERILLEGMIRKADGSLGKSFTAMNDIHINRHMMASLIAMDVDINAQPIDTFLGDGMIICTPTGSTAYNLSAGGPIVAPAARSLVITPLCVHSLNIRSIVTSENDIISVKIGLGKNEPGYPSIISIDGQKNEWLMPGDTVFVKRSERTVPIVKVQNHTFYQTLKQKLF